MFVIATTTRRGRRAYLVCNEAGTFSFVRDYRDATRFTATRAARLCRKYTSAALLLFPVPIADCDARAAF